MLHIVIGIVAIFMGLWGIAKNWYMFLDIVGILVPLVLVGFGVVALLAGIRATKKNAN
ncbi:MAG: hypothetical protein HQL29_02885 [Candidatus Omnitrophica bacterium]|nr:hypothetical protein [Candidatus Omnitrophota bacterium]